MYRVKVICNPKANRGHNARLVDELRKVSTRLGGADWAYTEAPGHATVLAALAAQQGYRRVVAAGGDGTLHEVVNGLMQSGMDMRPQLGIVPIGSGNDFVRGAAVTADPVKAMEHAFNDDHALPIDAGFIRIGNENRTYWVNVVGVGFDAAVTLQSQHITKISGKAMYFVAAVRTIIENYEAPRMAINIDGEVVIQHVQMLTVGNGPREGGGFITTPASKIDDGLLDFVLFTPVSRAMMVRLIPEVMRGTHGRFEQVRIGTLRSLRLHSDRPLLVHSDGEMVALYRDNVRDIEVGIEPAALQLVHG